MKCKSVILSAFTLLTCSVVLAQDNLTTLSLQLDKSTATVSPTLYGLMTEEINYSYEGGLYAQLVRNPSFKDMAGNNNRRGGQGWGGFNFVQKPAFWSLTDSLSADMSIDRNDGINAANKVSLCLNVKEGGKASGIQNDGYWGFPVRPKTTFNGGFFAKSSSGNATLNVSLVSLDGKKVYASTTVSGVTGKWEKYKFSFTTGDKVIPTKDVRLAITANEAGKYWFTRVTLFPPTFNNRENGLRVDLMTMMRNMSPKFLRFPGGNYLEGNTFADRFDWKKTIGNPDERVGH
jgi:alpha-N-arabinofuranosidase